ncbi:MAG: hypothetical protein QM802_20750 [Agriterribacter sp.]
MKNFHLALLLIIVLPFSKALHAQEKGVYKALASNNVKTIDKQLAALEKSNATEDEAYKGTLLMKKAGLVKGPGKKLKIFKEGRLKLEKAIDNHKDNGEYRFLRLMIQENAPGILGYNKEMDEDLKIVQQKYKSLSSDTRDAILSYSKTSKKLKAASLE